MTPRSIVVLTGAGISAESGIRTFRASDGLWEDHRVEDVASPEGFRRDANLVHRFYSQRRAQLLDGVVAPNAAHLALAAFEANFDGEFLLVTQNVDDLHERAGSRAVLHMHGELLKLRCQATGEVFSWKGDSSPASVCDCCGQSGRLRPHIVWFGEIPFEMERIERALVRADLFVSIGTSGNVYPAAGFARVAGYSGARTVELNLEPSANASNFDEGRYGPGTSVVPACFQEIEQSSTISG